MTKETNSNLMDSPWILERRFFGLSNNLLDLFGFGTGILAALPLFYVSKKKDYKYLLAIPLLLLVCILNSRTGILIFSIGVLVWLAAIVAKKTSLMKTIASSILIIPLLLVGVNFLYKISPSTMEWIENDFSSFLNPEEQKGTATAIYSEEFWALPEAERALFGTGHNASAYSSNKMEETVHSDNGYINEIWKVGFIGLALFLGMNFFIIRTCHRNEEEIMMKMMYVFFGISMLVFMIKGSLTGYNPGNVIIYTLFIETVMNVERRIER